MQLYCNTVIGYSLQFAIGHIESLGKSMIIESLVKLYM